MLEHILFLLGLSDITEDLQNKLETIIEITEQRLCVKLNTGVVPEELQYIVTEVSIIRFNRIGSEGVTSHNVQGESMAWNTDDDFKPYEDDIKAWLDAQEDPTTNRGRLRFI